MNKYYSCVTYENGAAQVKFGSQLFTVARRDAADGHLCCPIELVVGALGS